MDIEEETIFQITVATEVESTVAIWWKFTLAICEPKQRIKDKKTLQQRYNKMLDSYTTNPCNL